MNFFFFRLLWVVDIILGLSLSLSSVNKTDLGGSIIIAKVNKQLLREII